MKGGIIYKPAKRMGDSHHMSYLVQHYTYLFPGGTCNRVCFAFTNHLFLFKQLFVLSYFSNDKERNISFHSKFWSPPCVAQNFTRHKFVFYHIQVERKPFHCGYREC